MCSSRRTPLSGIGTEDSAAGPSRDHPLQYKDIAVLYRRHSIGQTLRNLLPASVPVKGRGAPVQAATVLLGQPRHLNSDSVVPGIVDTDGDVVWMGTVHQAKGLEVSLKCNDSSGLFLRYCTLVEGRHYCQSER